MPNRYWSDLHLGHRNIITYCNRPFESVGQMDATILANWRMTALMYPDDPIYCMGDVTLWNRATTTRVRASAVAKLEVPKAKLLVLGNHDSQWAQANGLYDHMFERVVGDPKAITDFREMIWEGDQHVWLSHAPIEPNLLLGGLNVYGHIHAGYDTQPDQMDATYPWLRESKQHFNCSVERTGYTPVTLDELRERQAARGHP